MNQSMSQGFQQGSGVTSAELRAAIQAITLGITILIMGSNMLGLWKNYSTGTLTQFELVSNVKKVFLAVGIIFVVLTVV